MDFIYIFRSLLKKKWIILLSAILAAVVAYYFTRNEEKDYRSTAQISTSFTVSDEIKVNSESYSFFEADTKFSNVIVTCTSPTVLSLVSYTLILHDLTSPDPFRQLSPKEKISPIYMGLNKEEAKNIFANKLEVMSMLTSFKPDEKKLIELLQLYGYDYKSIEKSLNVYRLQRTDYIQIDYISENPILSAFVVNTVFQQFLRYYKSVRGSKSQESIDTLQSLLEKKKQALDEKNNILKGKGLVDGGLENSSNLDLIMALETKITEEKSKQTTDSYALQKINNRLAALSEDKDKTAKGTPNKSNTDETNNELLLLKKARDDAYTAYLNSGSYNQSLLKKYNDLKARYESKIVDYQESNKTSETSKLTDNAKSDLIDKKNDLEVELQASATNIDAIQSKINLLKGNLTKDASKSAEVEVILKEVELANKEYLAAKQHYNDAIDINSSSVNNFRQILMGQPAIEPEPSKRLLLVGMAGVATMILSVLIIILAAYLDSSVKTPGVFAKNVNLKLINIVNFMNFKKKDLINIVAKQDGMDDPTDKKRINIFRESIRKLRYEIENSGKRIFLFTSTSKGQGKTTLITALSYSLSLSKKKILIIDTNFSNNDLTTRLHAEPILEKIDAEESSSATILERVRAEATDIGAGSVFVIGSEGGDYTPSEILPKEHLLQHLQVLTQEYNYIFLEGPPLNDFSDSREMIQYVEGVIAVFSANHIIKQLDKESIAFLSELNSKFIGSILNMVDLENLNVT